MWLRTARAGSAQAASARSPIVGTTIVGLHVVAPVSVTAPTRVTKLGVTTLRVS